MIFKTLSRLMAAVIMALIMNSCSHWNTLIGEKPPAENIKMASLFQDNMVIQRDTPVVVWGWCESYRTVTIELLGEKYEGVSDKNGRWEIKLKPLPACGPISMIVKGEKELTIKNIMVGEVWICAGQSNMEWQLKRCKDGEKEAQNANYSQIRFFQVDRVSTVAPRTECNGKWLVCSPDTAPNFSGVGYFFGRDLYKNINVAVGLIEISWGGTMIEAWMPWDLQAGDPEYRDNTEKWKRFVTGPERERLDKMYQDALQRWEKADKTKIGPERHVDAGNHGFAQGWAIDADTTGWTSVRMPDSLENYFGDIDGAVWFRKDFDLPAAWKGSNLVVELGPVDDFDETYFNGEAIGETGAMTSGSWELPRVYRIPASATRSGLNTLAIRVFDNFGGGGLTGRPNQLKIYPENHPEKAISLAGAWLARIELALDPFALGKHSKPMPPPGPGHRNWPSGVRSGMVAPVVPYAIRGAIWYQGESNTGNPGLYRRQLQDMVKEWRSAWERDFYFLAVQLPNFKEQWPAPQDSLWAEMRESQMAVTALPNTGVAVIIDLGEAHDIHPTNKTLVGFRLACLALANIYGKKFYQNKKFVSEGPILESMVIRDDKAFIKFKNVGNGLMVKNESVLRHFAVAGKDGHYVWANAAIEGKDTVVVWSGKVAQPVSVRYAWADNPAGCNLYNMEGFPAAPFQATRQKDVAPVKIPAPAGNAPATVSGAPVKAGEVKTAKETSVDAGKK